jgi:micrococcal nuclease
MRPSGSGISKQARLADSAIPDRPRRRPEIGQPLGTNARDTLAAKVFKKTVLVEVVDFDHEHRKVAKIYLFERFINMEMVRDGSAWRTPQDDKPGAFTAAENDARENRRGLWADPNAVPPWEWRKMKVRR